MWKDDLQDVVWTFKQYAIICITKICMYAVMCVCIFVYIYIQTYMLAYKHIHICVYVFLFLKTLLMDRQTRNWKQSLSLGRGIMWLGCGVMGKCTFTYKYFCTFVILYYSLTLPIQNNLFIHIKFKSGWEKSISRCVCTVCVAAHIFWFILTLLSSSSLRELDHPDIPEYHTGPLHWWYFTSWI